MSGKERVTRGDMLCRCLFPLSRACIVALGGIARRCIIKDVGPLISLWKYPLGNVHLSAIKSSPI